MLPDPGTRWRTPEGREIEVLDIADEQGLTGDRIAILVVFACGRREIIYAESWEGMVPVPNGES